MRAWSHDGVVFPLPDGHRFPITKYPLLRERVAASVDAWPAEPISWDALAEVHDPQYLARVREGRMSRDEQRALGIDWSPELVERGRRSTQATVAAARDALVTGYGINLGGGTHHARRSSGRGFCLFNDVAAAVFSSPEHIQVLVVDTDVHQGDGTADLLTGHPRVVTLSLHGAANYPFDRVPSDIDVELPRNTGDDAYLEALEDALDRALELARPHLVIYLAGADPWEGDTLGTLALTKPGLAARDALVVQATEAVDASLCLTLAGGYAPDVTDTVDINAASVELVASRWRARAARPS
ncbi:MAG: histone deacetylase [Thermoleophilia bacterium]|nr:histone deacetylase [Thermoleophilia bacterium]